MFCTAEQQSICLWQRCLFLVQDGISDSCFLVTISFTQELGIWMQDIDNLKFQVEQPKKLKHFKELSMSFESCSVECRDHPQAFPHWAASIFFFPVLCVRFELSYPTGQFQGTPFSPVFFSPLESEVSWSFIAYELPETSVALLCPFGILPFHFISGFHRGSIPCLKLSQEQPCIAPAHCSPPALPL